MQFYELNNWFWGLPDIFHLLVFALLVALYAHLFFGFWLHRKRIPMHVKKYFIPRTCLYLFYILAKTDDSKFGMLDLFLPIFLLAYVDGLIILNGFGFYRCKGFRQAIIKIFNFHKL